MIKAYTLTYLQTVREAIVRERDAHSLINWLKRIGLAVLIILVLSVIVVGINRLFARSSLLLSAAREKYVSSLSTREANKPAAIYSSLLENIQDVFAAAGIEILSPSYNVMRTEESKS